MQQRICRVVLIALLSAVLPLMPALASCPPRCFPTRILVASPPGGAADSLTRNLAASLQVQQNAPVAVENRPGAGGATAVEALARSAPDGQTLLMMSMSQLTAPQLPGAGASQRLQPVTAVFSEPLVLLIRADNSTTTLQDFVTRARAESRPISLASSGPGTSSHLLGALFAATASIQATNIPYRGIAAGLEALRRGEVDAMFIPLSEAPPAIQSGTLRALAVTSDRRSEILPDVPSVAEAGFPEAVASDWRALMAPPGTPSAVVASLSASIREALTQPELRQALARAGVAPDESGPVELAARIRRESARWQALTRFAL